MRRMECPLYLNDLVALLAVGRERIFTIAAAKLGRLRPAPPFKGGMLMDAPNTEFAFAGSLEELKAKGRLVVHGRHRPILVVYDRGRVFALDNRCPHMGFPLERGSFEDGILTC